MTRCSERERDNDGTGKREKLLEALDVAAARMILLAVANARLGAGSIVSISLPKGKAIWHFDQTNTARATETPGNMACIMITV